MPESLFAALLHAFDRSGISQIARTLGESEQGIARGMESSIASVLGAMASRASDPGALRRMLDLVPGSDVDISCSKLLAGLSNGGSPLLVTGKKMVSSLFGSAADAVANAVGRECGINSATSATLLTLAAPLGLCVVKKRVQDDGLGMRELGALLQQESATIRSALPAGLADLLWPAGTVSAPPSPVIAQSVHPERSYAGWVGALGMALLALGGLWLWSHARRIAPIGVAGEASRMINETARPAETIRRTLPGSIGIELPANGPETRFLAIVNGADVNQNTWVDMDRLYFDPGSATLRADATEQLDNIAAILQAYPNTRILIAGYTDDVGGKAKNHDLSRARADAVKDALVARNIAADRLAVQAFGERHAAADNSTDAARARNRRVSMRVTQR
jgi:outer membrane protein OmpA-like peptidoglycan-associated protein